MTTTAEQIIRPNAFDPKRNIPDHKKRWSDWCDKWNASTNEEDQISLLHVGYQRRFGADGIASPQERLPHLLSQIEFYLLNVGDGWQLSRSEGTDVRTKAVERTFQFLKKGWPEEDHRLLQRAPGFMQILRTFFYVNAEANTIPNLPDKKLPAHLTHLRPMCEMVLLRICEHIWRTTAFEPLIFKYQTANPEKLAAAHAEHAARFPELCELKPWMIEILAALDRLDFLYEIIVEKTDGLFPERRLRMISILDDASIQKLEEIALRTRTREHDKEKGYEFKKAKTVEEAYYMRSPAALFLKDYEIRMEAERKNPRLIK
jgi:hypothetical protein